MDPTPTVCTPASSRFAVNCCSCVPFLGPQPPVEPSAGPRHCCIFKHQCNRNVRLMELLRRCSREKLISPAGGSKGEASLNKCPQFISGASDCNGFCPFLSFSGCFSANPVALILHTQKAQNTRLSPNPPPRPFVLCLLPTSTHQS